MPGTQSTLIFFSNLTLVVIILPISGACEAEYFYGREIAHHFESRDGPGDKVDFSGSIFLSVYFCCKQCLLFHFFKKATIHCLEDHLVLSTEIKM